MNVGSECGEHIETTFRSLDKADGTRINALWELGSLDNHYDGDD